MTKKRREPKDNLQAITGHDRRWWVRFIEQSIPKYATPKMADGHSRMLSYGWVGDVIAELFKTFPKDGPAYDPNMRIAYLTAFVLGTWWARCHHGKTFDTRRPVKIRQQSYISWRNSLMALVESLMDESEDPVMFNGKPHYENPFDPKAKSGKFV